MAKAAGNSTAELYANREGKSGPQPEAAGKIFAELDFVARRKDGAAAEQRVLAEIARLGLEHNAWELDMHGYTVLMPDQVGPPEFARTLLEKILTLSEEASGIWPDMATGKTHDGYMSGLGRMQLLFDVLFKDPMFERAVMNPAVLAIVTYLLGETCVLTAMSGTIKGPGNENVVVHTDLIGVPAPYPPFAQGCNASWVLTDYTIPNGCTLVEPGSHKRCYPPMDEEATDHSRCIPIEAPAGSVIIWHSNTWHGSIPRTAPGLRVGILSYFNRWYMVGRNRNSELVTQEMLDRNPERFATLMGLKTMDASADFVTRSNLYA